jgi:hypothetical protein
VSDESRATDDWAEFRRRRREGQLRFQQRLRERLEEALATMPEERAQRIEKDLRRHGHKAYADELVRIRREAQARSETDETGGPNGA